MAFDQQLTKHVAHIVITHWLKMENIHMQPKVSRSWQCALGQSQRPTEGERSMPGGQGRGARAGTGRFLRISEEAERILFGIRNLTK